MIHSSMRWRYPWLLTLSASALLVALPSPAASLEDFELHGYMRSGGRANSSDTPQCFKNKGPASGINEFRLGNECEDYGELNFVAHQLRAKTESDPFFKSNITLSFATNGQTATEPFTPVLREAYIDSGNFFDSRIKYWVGKRFYRDAAVHMNDDFYFANISGSGLGVYDIATPSGKIALAYFLEQTNPILGSATSTKYKSNFLDFRWSDFDLTKSQKLDFWGIYGNTRGGTLSNGAGDTRYAGTSGYALGLKHKTLLVDGTNALSVQYGTRLLDSLNLANVAAIEGADTVSGNNRLRFVEDLVIQPMAMLGLELTGRYERFRTTSSTTSGAWWDAGVRPIYSFSEHFGVATEWGISSVKYDAETGGNLLKRVTLAPELRLNPKYFASGAPGLLHNEFRRR